MALQLFIVPLEQELLNKTLCQEETTLQISYFRSITRQTSGEEAQQRFIILSADRSHS